MTIRQHKIYAVILSLFLCPFFTSGEEPDDDLYYNPNQGLAEKRREERKAQREKAFEEQSRQQEEQRQNRQTHYGVNLNAYGGGGNGFGYYGIGATPYANIPAGGKADITVGISIANTYFNGASYLNPYGEDGRRRTYNHTDAIIFASGTFYVNDRFTLFASGYANLNPDPSNPWSMGKGILVGGEYKISPKARIGFMFCYSEGGFPYDGRGGYGGYFNNPYSLANPYGRRPFGNPFFYPY